jgi:hypothetical protein
MALRLQLNEFGGIVEQVLNADGSAVLDENGNYIFVAEGMVYGICLNRCVISLLFQKLKLIIKNIICHVHKFSSSCLCSLIPCPMMLFNPWMLLN